MATRKGLSIWFSRQASLPIMKRIEAQLNSNSHRLALLRAWQRPSLTQRMSVAPLSTIRRLASGPHDLPDTRSAAGIQPDDDRKVTRNSISAALMPGKVSPVLTARQLSPDRVDVRSGGATQIPDLLRSRVRAPTARYQPAKTQAHTASVETSTFSKQAIPIADSSRMQPLIPLFNQLVSNSKINGDYSTTSVAPPAREPRIGDSERAPLMERQVDQPQGSYLGGSVGRPAALQSFDSERLPDGPDAPSASGADTSKRASTTSQAKTATLHLDGSSLGRWAIQHLERALSKPLNGMTGVDPRATIPRGHVSPF